MTYHGESCECADCGYQSGYAEDFGDGIREGERRMLRLVFIGAACAIVQNEGRYTYQEDGRLQLAEGVARAAANALRDLGDEDASRVLGERGW